MSNYITHYSKDDNGEFWYIMEKEGNAVARGFYDYSYMKHFYLDSLSVCDDYRNKGIGTELQVIREDIARSKGFKYCVLWVKKGTWMRKWYKRRGYEYYKPFKKEKAVWLRKKL